MQVSAGDEMVLIIACADGAGSAELSADGARIACEQFFDVARHALDERRSLDGVDRDILLGWYRLAQREIADEADRRAVPVRQLACTLLTALVGEHRTVFAQVGDGCIVYLEGERYECAFWPQIGEYANTTNFLTQVNLDASFEFIEKPRIDEVAAFSDGLQRLALSFTGKAVHQPFFGPVFATLRSEPADELAAPLRKFLSSPAVTERTDDDKTLVLATRLGST